MSARRHGVSPLTFVVAAALMLGVVGCGGLTTPDLSTGEVVGKLRNVDSSKASEAYVYVLGRPEITARIESDGSYRLEGVPVGPQKLVFYDGGEKAKIAEPVEVRKASRSGKDEDVNGMPVAATVYAIARARSGANCDDATFTVKGARVRVEREDGGRWVKLFPIPPGNPEGFEVGGERKGFKLVQGAHTAGAEASVDAVDIEFDVDDSDPDGGCRSGALCNGSLDCDEGDGRCRECDDHDAASCPNGYSCEHHACVLDGSPDGRDTCDPCATSAECGTSGTCVDGFCAHGASQSGSQCKAGFDLVGGKCYPRGVSLPVPDSMGVACTKWAAAFGAPCLSSAGCQNALAGGYCLKPIGATASTLGYCTAAAQGGCPGELGYGSEAQGYCVP